MPPKSTATKLEYTFKSDVLFKMLFVRYQHLLKRLVAVLLAIPLESIEEFRFINTDIPPDEVGKKFCRLDINMKVNGKPVNLEIQVRDEGNYPERALYYWARLYSAELPAGDNYALLPKTNIISILGFKLFDCPEVHSEYAVIDIVRNTILTDKLSLHFFELPKLQDIHSLDMNNEKDLWLALFNSDTKEELDELLQKGGAVMSEAIKAYNSVTATEEFKNLEWIRRKTMHDEAQAIYSAELRGATVERQKWQDVIAIKDTALADKDAALADKDASLAEKDTALADKDTLIAELIARLEARE